MSGASVRRLVVFCGACGQGLHCRCRDRLGDLADPCPCRCWADGAMTRSALLDMMRRQPVALARHIEFTTAFERMNTLDLHLEKAMRRRFAR
jgi:hypothetical protein